MRLPIDCNRIILLSRFFIGILIVLISTITAHAEIIPATSEVDTALTTTSYRANWNGDYCNEPGQGTWQKTGDAACAEARAIANCGGLQGIYYPGSGTYCYRTSSNIIVAGLVTSQTECPAGYTKNSQNKCEKVTYICPVAGGWTLSADQQTCSRPDCPAGYERDSNTGACIEPCPSGYVRNLSTMQCEIVCDSPLIRTPANTCDCPSPLTLIDGNACIGHDDKEMGERCEASSRMDF